MRVTIHGVLTGAAATLGAYALYVLGQEEPLMAIGYCACAAVLLLARPPEGT